jgi:cytochrome c peroxidase
MTRLFVFAAAVIAAVACGTRGGPQAGSGSGSGSASAGSGSGSGTAAAEVPVLPPAPPLPVPAPALPALPAGGPAVTPEQVALGELLFFDPRLSASGAVACATCHDPDRDWAGPGALPTADGKPNARRALALTDLAWRPQLGWDGRYAQLDALLGVHLRGQLGAAAAGAAAGIAALGVYRAHFQRAFGTEPDAAGLVTALGAFARTRYSPPAPWDTAEHGLAPTRDQTGTPEARGYRVFAGVAQCATCHIPPLYTDRGFHKLGLIASPDPGRGAVEPARRGEFATPPLRGAARRAAFFHDGSAATLEAAIDWHLAGGIGQGADRSIIDLAPIALTPAERADLIAFVRALSAPATTPYPRPALPQP